MTPCPAAVPQCVGISGGAASFCTLSCGEGGATPPDNGDAICLDAGAAMGTPACILQSPSDAGANMFLWSCGLQCGQAGGKEYGNCPSQLVCTGNIRQ
jgi:hypothetical protein